MKRYKISNIFYNKQLLRDWIVLMLCFLFICLFIYMSYISFSYKKVRWEGEIDKIEEFQESKRLYRQMYHTEASDDLLKTESSGAEYYDILENGTIVRRVHNW